MDNNSTFRFAAIGLLLALSPLGLHGQDAAPAPTPSFFFQDGDKPVVFLGDAITEQKLYTTLIETYTLSRFPTMKITFRNAGWDGDTSWLAKRGDFDYGFQRDVLALKPKAVVIEYGMDDARDGDAAYSKYLESLTKLVKGVEKANARVLLISPTPEERYEPNAPAGSAYNVMLKKYTDGLKIVSDNEKIPFIDEYTPLVAYIEAGRKAGVLSANAVIGDTNAARLTNEGIHPNWGGHFIMATIILQGMHAPADVSSVTLDAAAKSIIASQGCQIDWQDQPNGIIQFKRTDDALPWPIPVDPRIDLAMKIPGFDPASALNRYGLKVTGLKEAAYTLSIDNQNIGVYASADLANGVNLGWVKQGPIYDQEQKLFNAVTRKNDAYFERWRNVQLYEMPEWLRKNPGSELARSGEISRLDALISSTEADIETLRKPVQHTFRLVPVPK